jgi:hypothetical protein
MKVSQQLISQHFTKKIITNYLNHSAHRRCGFAERLTYNFRYQDLRIEPWFTCLWTNFGFISYRDLAEFTLLCTEAKAYQLPVKKLSNRLYLVKGKVKAWYAVYEGKCECMLYRLRVKRSHELPQFFKHFDKPFCHHILAKISEEKLTAEGDFKIGKLSPESQYSH